MATMTPQDKTLMIIDWFNERPDIDFDLTFVENMREKLDNHHTLTDNMENALDNIIERWHI